MPSSQLSVRKVLLEAPSDFKNPPCRSLSALRTTAQAPGARGRQQAGDAHPHARPQVQKDGLGTDGEMPSLPHPPLPRSRLCPESAAPQTALQPMREPVPRPGQGSLT